MSRMVYSYIRASQANLISVNGGGFNYIVQATNVALYAIVSNSWADVDYLKSTDGGLTWSPPISVFAGTLTAVAVWYDRWTPGLTTDLIHIVYTESVGSDTLYRTINTASSDALSTQTTIFNGASTVVPGGMLAITRSRGGNVYCRTTIDAGTEGGFFRLPNANVPNGAWDTARTINEVLTTDDQVILMPGFGADNQDIILLFWDASGASAISMQLYDDSANTWAETIILPATDVLRTTSGPHYAACCHTTDTEILMVAWSHVNTNNAELSFWNVTEFDIIQGTSVIASSAGDQGACAIGYDATTNEIYVFYCGNSDGSETWFTAVNIYYKISADGGTTWGPENQLTPAVRSIPAIFCCPRTISGPPLVMFLLYDVTAQPSWVCVASYMQPQAQSMIVM